MMHTDASAYKNSESAPIVLIVEDQPDNLALRVELFKNAGCTALGVREADDAIRELRASPGIDLVFTDIHLRPSPTDKSGVALAKLVKRSHSDLPVAGYSAYFDENQLSA